jgi:hypothetical protein
MLLCNAYLLYKRYVFLPNISTDIGVQLLSISLLYEERHTIMMPMHHSVMMFISDIDIVSSSLCSDITITITYMCLALSVALSSIHSEDLSIV